MEKKNLRVLVGYNSQIMQDNSNAWATWAAAAGTAGDMAYFKEDGTNISDSSALDAADLQGSFFVAMKIGANNNVKSDLIPFNSIKKASVQAAVAGTAKVVTIDSVSNVDCETEYCLKIRYESPEIAKTYGYQDLLKTYSYVTRCCGDACGCPDGSVWDALMGLAEQVNADQDSGMNNSTAKTIASALVRNSTTVLTVADYDNDENWTFTKGSNIVTCATDIDYGGGTDVVAGDFIGVIDTGAAGTISASNATYFRVEAADASALTITLDRPWHLDTVTFAGGGTDLQVLPKATGESYADSTWSLVLTGAGVIESTAASKMFTPTYVTDFHVGLECNLDCNASVSTSTDMVPPQGYGADIIQKELWARAYTSSHGIYGGTLITNQPISGTDYHASAGTTYTTLTVEYIDVHSSAATAAAVASPKKLIIAAHATQAGAENTEETHLDWWTELNNILNFNLDYATGLV
tara:strand:- start:7088 stop:8485 length:1398 start_codon:yes stop_codon:yes gene_type:complete